LKNDKNRNSLVPYTYIVNSLKINGFYKLYITEKGLEILDNAVRKNRNTKIESCISPVSKRMTKMQMH